MAKEDDPVRFGAEFGPYRSSRTRGVSVSTFKSLVWISNLGGLFLCVIALEMMIVQQRFWWGLAAAIAGIAIALFPSNYEITGMDTLEGTNPESDDEPTTKDEDGHAEDKEDGAEDKV